MKYLKGTLIAFAVTLIFSLSANAAALTFSGVTIPSMGLTYTSPQRAKGNTTIQTLETINIRDNATGKDRDIEARLVGMNKGMDNTAWFKAEKGKTASFGTASKTPGAWKLQIRAKKKTIANISYYGHWTYE